MIKAVDKTMVVGDIRLMSKTGGRSGTYTRREGRSAGRQKG
jgi:cyclic pyranopterin phosphate synthase